MPQEEGVLFPHADFSHPDAAKTLSVKAVKRILSAYRLLHVNGGMHCLT